MQTAYFEAVVNRRHRVLGCELHDFCLYDALFLTLQGNALWMGEPASLADLQEAVLICSLPPERFLRADLAPRSPSERLARWWWNLRCLRAHLRDELAPAFEAWEVYLADYDARPQLWDGTGGGRSLRAPWILSLAVFIEMHSNMTERQIMTAPIGAMFWKAQAIAERAGVSVADIMTQEEIDVGAEQRAALEAAGETFPDVDEEEGEEEHDTDTQGGA